MELTPTEVEMISLKREKELLDQKEKELREQIRLQGEVQDHEESIARWQKKDKEQVEQTKKFAKQLGEGWKIDLRQYTDKSTVYSSTGREEKDIFWCKEYERVCASIIKDTFKVEVVEKFVKASKYSFKTVSKGYEMRLAVGTHTKSYVRASKVNEIVNEAIKERELQKLADERKYNSIKTVIETAKTRYLLNPEVRVEYWREFNKFRTIECLGITFTNGVKQTYEIYDDGSLSIKDTKFPIGGWELMDMVSKMVFEKDEKEVA